jgi:NAD(P)H-dependent flavin oxidoreductase YrpB (nitropropane dioxygenase family)
MRPLFGILFTSTVTAMKNALTSLFPWVDLPLISPPMANVSGGRLAARVSRAGALGFIGIGHVPDPTRRSGCASARASSCGSSS